MTLKLKAILGGLVIAALGAAVAFAAPPPGKGHHHSVTSTGTTTTGKGHGHGNPHGTTTSGSTSTTTTGATVTVAAPTTTTKTHGKKPSTTGAGCKPAVTLVIKGTASADGSASALSLNITGGNHAAKPLFGSNTTTALTVNTTASTKVTANDSASALSSVKKGDRVLVQYKVCKADVTGTSTHVASANALSTFLASLSPRKVIDLGQGSDDENDNENDDD